MRNTLNKLDGLKFSRFNFFILFIALSFAMVASGAEKLVLTPQKMVDLVMGQGLEAKTVDLLAQRSYLGLANAQGAYDFGIKFNPSYQYSEAEDVAVGTGVWYDRRTIVNASISKLMLTGTTLTLGYDWQNFNYGLTSIGTSAGTVGTKDINSMYLTIRQNLWRNAFGVVNRTTEAVATATVADAMDTRVENLEDVLLNSMTLYWNAYTSQVQLRESISARQKYEELVKSARRRRGYNLSSPGEVPRLEAEYLGSESNVKSASAAFLNALEQLQTAMQLNKTDEIEFQVPIDVPAPPELKPVAVEELRSVRTQARRLEMARMNADISNSNFSPKLDLVLRGRTAGVDEERSRSVSEMSSGSKPEYFIGAEFETSLDSMVARGQKADARVAVQQAELELQRTRNQINDQLAAGERNVIASYHVAVTNLEIVKNRAKVVSEMEVAFRQGRQSLTELIRAYNELFVAQQGKARSIGDYNIALNRYAALRDELVKQR